MKKSFQHSMHDRMFGIWFVILVGGSAAYAGFIYSLTTVAGDITAYTDFLFPYTEYVYQVWFVAAIVWIIAIFLFLTAFSRSREIFILQDQEFIVQHGKQQKYIPYHAFIKVEETMRGLTLFTPDDRVIISCETERYDDLYNILVQKIPVFDELDQQTFPWTLASSKQGARQFVFDSDQIYINSDYKNSSLPPKRIKNIYIDPITDTGRRYGPYNQYEVVIQLNNYKKIIIDYREAFRFNCPPERITANLHSLYPFTKEVIEVSTTERVRLLLAKGEKFYRAGVYETAVLAYEQILDTEPLNRHIWQRFGDCLFELEQFEEAGDAYRQAVMLDNTDVESYWRGAIAFSRANNGLMAKIYLQEALNLDPQLSADVKRYDSLQKLL